MVMTRIQEGNVLLPQNWIDFNPSDFMDATISLFMSADVAVQAFF